MTYDINFFRILTFVYNFTYRLVNFLHSGGVANQPSYGKIREQKQWYYALTRSPNNVIFAKT